MTKTLRVSLIDIKYIHIECILWLIHESCCYKFYPWKNDRIFHSFVFHLTWFQSLPNLNISYCVVLYFKFWYLCIVLREGRKKYCIEYKEKIYITEKCCCWGRNFRTSFFSRRGVNLYFGDTINYSILFFVWKFKHKLIPNTFWCFFASKFLCF